MDFQKLSKQLFFAFLFLLPLQTVYLLREVFVEGEKWQYGSVALYGTDILLIAALVFFILSQSKTRAYYVSCIKYHVWLMLLALWGALSIAWSDDQALAVYAAVKLLLAAGVFFLARSLSDEDVKIALRVLIVGAVLESLLGIGQFLIQSTFASTLLGMSVHEVWRAGTSVLKNDSERWLRAYGTFEHPNVLGGFLSAVFVLCITYYVSCIEELKRNQRIAFFAGLIIILLGLILTFSRSAWLGAAMGMAVYYVLRIKYRVWGKWDTQMLLTLGIATAIFVGVLHETVFPRFDSVAIEREGSVSERVQSLRDAKVVMGEGNILLGTGAGNFTTSFLEKKGSSTFSDTDSQVVEKKVLDPFIFADQRPVWTVRPAHNVPVLVFAELGLVGLILFAGFLIFVLSPILKSKIVNHKSAILLALAPALLLDHYLWTSHFGLFFLFLLLGLASRKSWK